MTRGFEHRLWGYTVVKIKQPDKKRGIVSDSTSSVPSLAPTASHDDLLETGKHGPLEIEESSAGRGPGRDRGISDLEKGAYDTLETGEPTVRRVSESRGRSESVEERERVGEWQIPETVILTSESISPF